MSTLAYAPRITAPMVALLTTVPGAVVVQDDRTGSVAALDRLTAAQLDDPDLVVLIDAETARDAVAEHRTPAAAARALTVVLRAAHLRTVELIGADR